MIRPGLARGRAPRAGLTLTEILIGIMIMGVGLISVATLFPIGLLRLREAQRQTRSALLYESAASDMAARSLINTQSFTLANLMNGPAGFGYWYACSVTPFTLNGLFDPLIQDAPTYGGDVYSGNTQADLVGLDATNGLFHVRGSAGLPFCYDPLWRYQTGIHAGDADEARFGSGIGLIRNDPDGAAPSAHGLQRLTNFNSRSNGTFTGADGVARPLFVMPSSAAIPRIFVSPEDVVWNEPNNPMNLSTILPDRTISGDFSMVNDWRYSWFFTGRLNSASNAATFDGDLVICENRPFELDATTSRPADEIVVEGVFGHGRKVAEIPGLGVGYAAASDRTVLLRWLATQPDPIVKVGTWICDVTYERNQLRALNTNGTPLNPLDDSGRFVGIPNPLNGGKWDNLPAQRAFWYQVVKVSPAVDDPQLGANYRSMVVQVNSTLRARTPLVTADGLPHVVNAALIAPHVVNVVPRTVVVH
ncbi:hypothetical protein [Paludisphaera sp.]|uniref:type IV pilus modification PilV family protein n=1 Tax=Paludisphaera sp. TaxID=2017432 RepID=UPI00301BC4C2